MEEHKQEHIPAPLPEPRPNTGGISAGEIWKREAQIVEVTDVEL